MLTRRIRSSGIYRMDPKIPPGRPPARHPHGTPGAKAHGFYQAKGDGFPGKSAVNS
jgi:hypothetical protein